MSLAPGVRLTMLIGGAASLSGCVALALPAAASGLVAHNGLKRQHGRAPVAVAAAPASGLPAAAVLPPEPVAPPMQDPEAVGGRLPPKEPTGVGVVEPLPIQQSQGAAPTGVYKEFADFALNENDAGSVGVERRSAVLAPATNILDPLALPCGKRPSAVVIDTDVFDADVPVAQIDGAARSLRTNKVAVLWIGDGRGSGGVRARIARAGLAVSPSDRILDPAGKGVRKQVLRQEAAAQFCIVAVAGARRGDMDELFDYLRRDADAFNLDHRWGAGWFLMPPAH